MKTTELEITPLGTVLPSEKPDGATAIAGKTEAMLPQFTLRNILVPVDFSETSEKALRYAVPFARQFGAKISLLHVIEFPMLPNEIGIPTLDESELLADARDSLTKIGERTVHPELRGKTLVRRGTPWDEIVTLAREIPADLIITTTHGYTGLKHVFLGSTAELVVRRAPCPVLVVREQEKEFA